MTDTIDDTVKDRLKIGGAINVGGFVFGLAAGYIIGSANQEPASPYYAGFLITVGVNFVGTIVGMGMPMWLPASPGIYTGSSLGYYLAQTF